jgi:hypothetical protein
MKRIVLALLVASILNAPADSTISPDSDRAPLFQVYRLKRTAPDSYDNGPNARPTHHFSADGSPLITIYSLKDFLLEADRQSVRVVLMKKDASVFELAMHRDGVLGITAGDTAAIMISSKPFDGSITFSDPVAGYLRRRFHIEPGTNDKMPVVSTPPSSSR